MGIAIPQVITNRSGAQVIDGSLKFDSSKKNELRRTPSSAGNRRTWTWSAWVKRVKQGSDTILFAASNGTGSVSRGGFFFDNTNDLRFFSNPSGSSETANFNTNGLFRDTAWYHVVLQIDTTQSTNTDRIKIYVNGERQTPSSATYMAQNEKAAFNQDILHTIGSYQNGDYGDYHLTNVYFIDGAAVEPEEFGFTDPLTNTWKPKKYTGSFAGPAFGYSGTIPSSLTNVAPSGSYGNGIATAAELFGGTLLENGDNHIRQDGGGFEWSAAIPLSNGDVAGAQCLYFNNTSAHNIEFKIDGSWVNVQSNAQNVIGSTQGEGALITYTATGSVNWTGVKATGGSNISVTTVAGIFVNGDLVGPQQTPPNGFYLPFDGNSPIGEDKSGRGNDWTPVNFGGSVTLDNANVSGARPILNTTQGGSKAGVSVFGSKQNVGYAVTVYNDGGGNKYYIDGVKQDTVTGLIRGATYTFDTSDSTVSSHPFRFSATSNGSHGGGSEYTSGVAAITGAATTITVPHDAPNTLYYYCTSHSGMGADITGITTNEKLADQYASKCVLALPLVGPNSDVSASIACTSTTKSISKNGSPSSSPEQSNFYGESHQFVETNSDRLDCTIAALGTRDFTLEFWFYTSSTTGYQTLVEYGDHTSNGFYLSVRDGVAIMARSSVGADIANAGGGTPGSLPSGSLINTPTNKYHHIALTRESNTAKIFQNGKYIGSGTWSTNYTPTNLRLAHSIYSAGSAEYLTGFMQDVRLYDGVVKYTGTTVNEQSFVVPSANPDVLPDTPSGVSGGSKLTKITEGAVNMDTPGNENLSVPASEDFNFGTGDFTIEGYFYIFSSGGNNCIFDLRDSGSSAQYFLKMSSASAYELRYSGSSLGSFSAPKNRWNHIAISRSSATTKIFVNGIVTNSFSDSNDASNTGPLLIGTYNDTTASASSYGFNGAVSNFRVIKGTALYTSRFTPPSAPLTNVTNTKLLCCQSPTSAAAATVIPTGSITANNVEATNFNPFNTDISTVRGQETGYATLNPHAKANISLSDGNLALTHSGSNGNWQLVLSTIGMSSGKFYCEFLCQDADSVIGIAKGNHVIANDKYVGQDPGGYSYNGQNGQKINNSSGSSYGSSYTAGDLIGIAFDGDNGTLRFYKNNVDQGQAFSSLTDEYFFAFSIRDTGYTHTVNFGQKPFKFPPPDGFQPLNAANIRPETVISRPDQYVGIVTYTGDGTNNRVIQAPIDADFAWIKFRNQSYSHSLYDTVRGNNTRLVSNSSGAEGTVSFSFLENKNIQISGASDTSQNDNNEPLVGWFWKAGGNKDTFNVDDVGYATAAAAGLDSGSIAVTGASVGTKQGFSIIAYTGTGSGGTISHGLSEPPVFSIIKNRDADASWPVWMTIIDGSYDQMYLELTDAKGDLSQAAPTSTVFTNTGSSGNGASGQKYISYHWHNVPGLQKFGSYVANGGNTGPVINCGFRPRIVWVKRSSSSDAYTSWSMFDTERDPYNAQNRVSGALYANKNAPENRRGNASTEEGYESINIHFLSNGFQLMYSGGEINGPSGTTYIYAAWAEAPTVDLYGGGANAR